MTPFEQFKSKLRDAGVRLEIHNEFGPFTLMFAYLPNGGIPVRFMVNDDTTRGYSIYVESREMKIDEDVKAILAFQDA